MILPFLVLFSPSACADSTFTSPRTPAYEVTHASAASPAVPTFTSPGVADQRLKPKVDLPRVFLDFSYPAVTGRSIRVDAGDNLQRALNNAQRGDEIVLAAGATFTGNFVLPVKSGTSSSGWIVIRGEQSSQLPPIGTRVTPGQAGLMPKLVTANTDAALKTAGATSGWWLTGLEVTVSPAVTAQQYGIVMLGEGGYVQKALSSVPTDIVLDRM